MISTKEALKTVLNHTLKVDTQDFPLIETVGKVTTQSIIADRDFPPFDRVSMDGICVHLERGDSLLPAYEIVGMATAGTPQQSFRGNHTAYEVMTGCIIPEGYNTVIPYEDLLIQEGVARLRDGATCKALQNVHLKGTDQRSGAVLISENSLISPAEIGVAASVGKSSLPCFSPMRFAVVSTGDELVELDQTPLDYQIRTSNSIQLVSALRLWGQQADRFHINDEFEPMKEKLELLLKQYDVLILSGGVSRGKKDFVPDCLDALGIEKKFHRVAQRPGKPFWFGSSKTGKVVFALPGNPVSTFLCLHKYVYPWIFKSYKISLKEEWAVLGQSIEFVKPLTYFAQVSLRQENGKYIATPLLGKGSGDLVNLVSNDAFIELEASRTHFEKGELLPLIRFRK